MGSVIALRLYRTLLRQACSLQKSSVVLEARKPLSRDEWGSYCFSTTGADYQAEVLQQILPGLSIQPEPGQQLTGFAIHRLVRDNFKALKNDSPDSTVHHLDKAICALRALFQQRHLQRCTSSLTTDGVNVTVTSSYVKPIVESTGQTTYVFSYRVRVSNTSPEPVQILGRGWIIQASTGKVHVHLPSNPDNAVVGQQPIIKPGGCFEYVSGTDLPTPCGAMQGELIMRVLDEKRLPKRGIMAKIPRFPLLSPDYTGEPQQLFKEIDDAYAKQFEQKASW